MTKQEMKFWARVFECAPELPFERMQYWIEHPNKLKFLLVQLAGSQVGGLITHLGTITTSATTEKFVAREKFTKGSEEVNFWGFGSNFEQWFLDKVEEPIDQQELRYGKLEKNSVNGPIIKELGGEVKAETTLSEMFSCFKKQPKGEDGVLLTNGYANIFYIRDASGVLRVVLAYWDAAAASWVFDADSVGYPNVWRAGYRIFSRNS